MNRLPLPLAGLLLASLVSGPAIAADQNAGPKPLAPALAAPTHKSLTQSKRKKRATADAEAQPLQPINTQNAPAMTPNRPESPPMQSAVPSFQTAPAPTPVPDISKTASPAMPARRTPAKSKGPATPAPAKSTAGQTPAAKAPTRSPQSATAGTTTPAPPTFADDLHKALEAFLAKKIDGQHAWEIRKLRKAIAAFYAARHYAPLWVTEGGPNAAARAVMVRLARAADDGLSVAALPASVFDQGAAQAGEHKTSTLAARRARLAAAELALSLRVVAYGRQASGSRVAPHEIGRLIGAEPHVASAAQILSSVAAAGAKAGRVLEAFNPPQRGYRALRAALAQVRRDLPTLAAKRAAPGPLLKAGMRALTRAPTQSRAGLNAGSQARQDGQLDDIRLAAAVATFPKADGLLAPGALSPQKVAALSHGQPQRLENALLANMEFWRWMPRHMGRDRIEVNIPGFTVRVFRNNHLVWRNKVIVGKPRTPTPVFSGTVRYIIVNPYWNVPQSILRKEILPHVARDPSYLRRHGFQMFRRHGRLSVRQVPGPRNALGRIKFVFPNNYAVYMHDTPSRYLFRRERRAFSHGCVRAKAPFGLAQAVLGPDGGWSEPRLRRLIGYRRHFIYLKTPLPIHLDYFTAFVDSDGHLQLRADLYHYTDKMEIALGLPNPGLTNKRREEKKRARHHRRPRHHSR